MTADNNRLRATEKIQSILITTNVGFIKVIHLNSLRIWSRWTYQDGGNDKWKSIVRYAICAEIKLLADYKVFLDYNQLNGSKNKRIKLSSSQFKKR